MRYILKQPVQHDARFFADSSTFQRYRTIRKFFGTFIDEPLQHGGTRRWRKRNDSEKSLVRFVSSGGAYFLARKHTHEAQTRAMCTCLNLAARCTSAGTPLLRLKHGSPKAMVNGELVHSRAPTDTWTSCTSTYVRTVYSI